MIPVDVDALRALVLDLARRNSRGARLALAQLVARYGHLLSQGKR